MIIIATAVGITLCICLCCTGISRAISKPKGANDRWTTEELARVNTWLEEEVGNGN